MGAADDGWRGSTSSRYAGARALVIGGSGGIGAAFVREFLEYGADVALTYCRRRPADADLVPGRVRCCRSYQLDLRDRGAIEPCCARLVAECGAPSIIVNCAGLVRDRPFVQMTEVDWDAVMGTNLHGPADVLRHLVPAMIKNGGGHIVNVASLAGLCGVEGQSNYAASKGGLIALTRALARELGPFNIRVNALAPGFVETDMTSHLSDTRRRRVMDRIPLRRFAAPEEIVAAGRVLVDPAVTYLTGHVLVVDGGLSA